MSTLWDRGRWNQFRWGQSVAFEALLDQKIGAHVKRRIIWELDAGDQDITSYFLGIGAISREKERAPDRMTSGDCLLVFNNADDVFTEEDSASFLHNVKYHNRNITIEVGFLLDDGTTEYVKVATMKVRSVTFDSTSGSVNIRCYDLIQRLLGEKINRKPSSMVAVAAGANTGNGKVSDIYTKPFVTVTENWTLTCTLGGADGVATFSVVGSVSGNIGTATSGTEFLNATTGGIKFTISVGAANWVIGDVFTFSTVKMMQWTATNPGKIIFSILTGKNYDTGASEDWITRTPQLDGTRTTANVDIDWGALEAAVDALDDIATLKGYIPWDSDLSEEIENIILHFLGSVNCDASGRLVLKVFIPEWSDAPRDFADTKKVREFGYKRDMRDMMNRCSFIYRKTDAWPWSDENEEDTLDGYYTALNQDSYDDYGQWFDSPDFTTRWYNANGDHVSYPATRLVDKYGRPPKAFSFKTGIDGLVVEPGDVVTVTDEKSQHTTFPVEVMRKDLDIEAVPVTCKFVAEDTGTTGIAWAFLGSSADEGDGISPQAASFDNATQVDKTFAYLSQTGGSGSATGPDYYLF